LLAVGILDKIGRILYDSVYAEYSENHDTRVGVVNMAKGDKNGFYCLPTGDSMSCCRVESLVSVDERGQMVLPKEVRDKANIHAGDKLAVVSWERDGAICCISLIKAQELTEMIKGMLGPMMKEILR